MAELPMTYETAYEWGKTAKRGKLEISERTTLEVGSPHDTDAYSPEHMLLAAAEVCLANTMLVMSERSGLALAGYRSTAFGELEFEKGAGYRFKRIVIKPRIEVAADAESLAGRLIDKAHRACLIARSLACPVDIEPVITQP